MSLAALLSGDTVVVTPYLGETAYGPGYGEPVTVDCRVESDRKLVRSAEGDEVVSEATIYVLPDVNGTPAVDLFTMEAVVTYQGRQARVISASPRRGQGPPVFVEVTVT